LTIKISEQTFPGKYSQLKHICEFVGNFAREVGFPEDVIYPITLAVDEACSNIIEHAYGSEQEGCIDCTCSFAESILAIALRDDGKAFSPDEIPHPDIKAPLKHRKAHGLGYYFIQHIMDEVSYTPNAGNGNLLILRKQLG
jgi:serine/threonine-protein kinase RsbW